MMPESLDLRQFMNALEKSLIQRALRATGGAQRLRVNLVSRAAMFSPN